MTLPSRGVGEAELLDVTPLNSMRNFADHSLLSRVAEAGLRHNVIAEAELRKGFHLQRKCGSGTL